MVFINTCECLCSWFFEAITRLRLTGTFISPIATSINPVQQDSQQNMGHSLVSDNKFDCIWSNYDHPFNNSYRSLSALDSDHVFRSEYSFNSELSPSKFSALPRLLVK